MSEQNGTATMPWTVGVEVWDEEEGKGIDDLYAGGGAPRVVTGDDLDELIKEIRKAAGRKEDAPDGEKPKRDRAGSGGGSPHGTPPMGNYPLDGTDEAHLTDRGNALRFVARHGQDLRYCHPWKKWLVWDSKRWRLDDEGRAQLMLKRQLAALYRHASQRRAALMGDNDNAAARAERAYWGEMQDWLINSEAGKQINAALSLAASECGIPILPDDMERDAGCLFNVQNGTIDLRTGQLREHRREDCLITICPLTYDPNATCPTWDKTVRRIFKDDSELVVFVKRLLGRCLSGDVSEQLLPICWGCGGNGKTLLLDTVRSVMGSGYAMKADADLLMASKNDRHPTERAQLFRMRLVLASESEEGRNLKESLVKDLTGGERVRARRMREDFWEFDPTHKIILITNHKPRIVGTDEGIWRRPRLIPFEARFWSEGEAGAPDPIPEDQLADKNLPRKLRNEMAGILTWLVQGCLDWQREGLTLPEKVKVATEEYRKAEDVIGRWLEECCVIKAGDKDFKTRAGVLLDNLEEWCLAAGCIMPNSKKVSERLLEKGLVKVPNNGIWYVGIRLLEC